jgi:hypothetical protein
MLLVPLVSVLLCLFFSQTVTITTHTTLLTPRTLLIPPLILLDIRRGSKLTLRPNPLTVQIEENRHRRKHNRHAPDKGAGPLYTHTVKHLRRKQRKDAAKYRTHECVCCNCGGSKHQVRIDDVIQQAEKNAEDAKAGEQAAQHGHDPWHVAAVARPAEPEQAAGEQNAADHANGQTPFRNRNVVVGLEFLDVAWVGEDDDNECDEFASYHAEVGQAGDAGGPAVDALEDEGVCCQDCSMLGGIPLYVLKDETAYRDRGAHI